jgi:hypothetical protein
LAVGLPSPKLRQAKPLAKALGFKPCLPEGRLSAFGKNLFDISNKFLPLISF